MSNNSETRYAKYVNEPWLWHWGHSFRFRQQNLCEIPSSGEITMTSYPVSNKTSLSRKPCIPGTKLLWNAISKSWSLFQNPSQKFSWSALCGESRWSHIRLAIIPRYLGNHASQMKCYMLRNAIRKSWSLFQNPSWKNAWSTLVGEITMTLSTVGNKTSLSRIPCIADKKLLLITIMKSWSLNNLYKNSKLYSKNLSVYKCC